MNKQMVLYHYYDRKTGPFKNLSDISIDEAEKILRKIKEEKSTSFAAQRQASYMQDRLRFEKILKDEFLKKGGLIERNAPHYLVVGKCMFLESWYEDCDFIEIPIEKLDIRTVSFTYGDSHPTFSDRVNDGKEYRKKLYTYEEILKIIHSHQ